MTRRALAHQEWPQVNTGPNLPFSFMTWRDPPHEYSKENGPLHTASSF